MNRKTGRPRAAALSLSIFATAGLALSPTLATGAIAGPLRPGHVSRGPVAVPRNLLAAARSQTLADRRLVADARALGRCLVVRHADPSRCTALRRALQHAGVRLASAEHELARIASSSAGASRRARIASAAGEARRATIAARRPPLLSLDGAQLSWSHGGHVHDFLVERRLQGYRPAEFFLVEGTSWTPAPLPGRTVHYRVRTAVEGSRWSNRQAIAYASTASRSSGGRGGESSWPGFGQETPSGKRGSHSGETSPGGGEQPSKGGEPGPHEAGSPPESAPPHESTPEPEDAQAAPVVSVSGDTLSWPPVAHVGVYVLQTRTPGHSPSFSEVNGSSVTPPAVPGATVRYSVRTAVEGSAWSSEVAISYPAAPKEEAPTEGPSGGEAPTSGFEPGINSGYEMNFDLNGSVDLGAKIVRIAFEDGTTPAEMEPVIAGYAAKGIRVAPLLSFYGSMPSPAQAHELASWAQAYGPGGSFWATHGNGQLAIRTIEFGNETSGGYQYGDGAGQPSYQERAETYAVRLKEAYEAIAATGKKVGLLAVAEDWTGDWMDGMFKAVPNLGSYVAGWVSHPYGPTWRTKIEDIISQSAAHGASPKIPIDVTEWGLSSDDGDCVEENFGYNACMSDQQAAETLRTTVGEIRQFLGSRTGLFLFFAVRDEKPLGTSNGREYFMGLLQHEDQAKGAYTSAAEEVLKS